MIEKNKIYCESCLDTMSRMEDNSIDLLLQDMPYGVTHNNWDKIPDLGMLWKEWLRITKRSGAMIFTAQQPFSTDLITSNRNDFKYDLIWEKSRATGFLNSNKQPLRNHEQILLFYREQPVFNPQKNKGNPNHVSNGKMSKSGTNNNYGNFGLIKLHKTEYKFPKSVIYFQQSDPNTIIHPTQKPLDLFRYLIKTYSNEDDFVYDGYMGSGTTAHACILEKRNWIGSEISQEYVDLANKRIDPYLKQTTLF